MIALDSKCRFAALRRLAITSLIHVLRIAVSTMGKSASAEVGRTQRDWASTSTDRPNDPRAALAVPEKPRFGIVVGHVGIDPDTGTVNPGFRGPDGLTEVEANRTVARVTASGLENLDLQVDLLDEFDERLRSYRAVAVISIQADTCEPLGDKATGYKVGGATSGLAPEQTQQLVGCMAERYERATNLAYLAGVATFDLTDYHTL